MLSRQDIIDFCALTDGEVCAIAKHERLSDISAASLGQSLLRSSKGTREIERFINDEMESAVSCGKPNEGEDLQQVLAEFRGSHSCSDSDVVDEPE